MFELAVLLISSIAVDGQAYYDGRWDSTLYNFSDHPHTIALRVAVEDSETRLPLEGVEVTLEGEYEEESNYGQPEAREYKLKAITEEDGIAVFGLLWHEGSSPDDIEKISRFAARKDGYRFADKSLNFGRIIQGSVDFDPDGWKNLIRETPGAKYFLPVIGVNFDDWNNENCLKSVFFRLVRDEDYGEVFRAKDDTGHDFPDRFMTSNPQREAGPFMMLPVTFRLHRVFEEQHVTIEGERHRGWVEDRPQEDSRPPRHHSYERTEPRDERVWERYGDGYISEDQYNHPEKYINESMTREQVFAVFGPPSNSLVSQEEAELSWQSWENSRHGIIVVVNNDGDVIRIERED